LSGGGEIKSTAGYSSCLSWYPNASLKSGDKLKYAES